MPRQRFSVLTRSRLVYQGIEQLSFIAKGGHLTYLGGNRPDLLDGGAGRDGLFGNGGRDRCLGGERLSSCEVKR